MYQEIRLFQTSKTVGFIDKRFSYGKYSKKKLNNSVKVKDILDLSSVIAH